MELHEAMQKALNFEKQGFEIYSEASEKTKNPIVEKTFKYLAEQETFHIEEITRYISEEHPDLELKGDQMDKAKEFFNTTIEEFKGQTDMSEDDIKAHETGMNLERSAYSFYKEQLNLARDENLKRFLKFLMDQEAAHFEILDKAYRYAKDPENFFAEEEAWIFEGG